MNTSTLYLLRHGEALDRAESDAMRPLSTLGEAQAMIAARTLQQFGVVPQLILHSPYMRARQMALPSHELFPAARFEASEHLVPSSDQRNIIELLNSRDASVVLLVGHEPHLSSLLSVLIVNSRLARIEMRKASLGCVETATPIEKGKGMLRWILTIAQMKLISPVA